jgi:hypothetical protein
MSDMDNNNDGNPVDEDDEVSDIPESNAEEGEEFSEDESEEEKGSDQEEEEESEEEEGGEEEGEQVLTLDQVLDSVRKRKEKEAKENREEGEEEPVITLDQILDDLRERGEVDESEEDGEPNSKNVKKERDDSISKLSKRLYVGRFSDFKNPFVRGSDDEREPKVRKARRKVRRPKTEEDIRIEKQEREERSQEQLDQKRKKRKRVITEVFKNKIPETDKYTLWRNLREYLNESKLDDPLKNWTENAITPSEMNCMVKQSTQCSSSERLDEIMPYVNGEYRDIDPGVAGLKIYEVFELLQKKTSVYHSRIGSLSGTMVKADREGRQRKSAEIKRESEDYAKEITDIVTWMLEDDKLQSLYPEEDMPEDIIQRIKTVSKKFKETDETQLSLEVRKRAVERRIFRIINLDVSLIINGAEQIAKQSIVVYNQQPGNKAKKNLGDRRYLMELEQMLEMMFRWICIRDELETIVATIVPNSDANINDIVTRREYADALFIRRQRMIADTFQRYLQDSTFEDTLKNLMIKSKLIPSPYAQETYLVNSPDSNVNNLLMFPDRIANTYDPDSGKYIIPNAEIRMRILSEQLDPWNWYAFRVREEHIPGNIEKEDWLKKNGTSKVYAYYQQAFALQKIANLYDWDPEDPELSRDGPVFTEEYFNSKDIEKIRSLTRVLNNSRSDKRSDDVARSFYSTKYVERLERNINEFTDPDSGEPIIMGDLVNCGYGSGKVKDIIHPGEENGPLDLDCNVSEFTLYTESFFPDIPTEVKKTTYGSYLTYRIDKHPQTSKKRGQLVEGHCGHAYYLVMSIVGQKAPIWLKATQASRKPEKSLKDYKVFDKVQGWFGKTIQIDAICENSASYPWDSFPEWMLLMFKLLSSIIYKEKKDAMSYLIMIPLDRLKLVGNVPESLMIYFLVKCLNFALCVHGSTISDER